MSRKITLPPLAFFTVSRNANRQIYFRPRQVSDSSVYITNHYDFKRFTSLKTAHDLFSGKPFVSFSSGNAPAGQKSSQLVNVKTADLVN